MDILNFSFMCLYIGIYLSYQLRNKPLPDILRRANTYICWAFLIWAGFMSGRIIVDCLMLSAQGQMSAGNVRDGILLAVLNFLPNMLMSVFMLKEGFAGEL